MKQKSRQHYEARARIAKAMAHPTRLLFLEVLQERELCVCELTEMAGADQSTVSKHLAVLRQAGLVTDRREGSLVYYKLRACCLESFWRCLESVLQQNLQDHTEALGTCGVASTSSLGDLPTR